MPTQLSIITVNYKSWNSLAVLLEGLQNAREFSTQDWEMIVIDNQSGDGRLAEFRRHYGFVQFIENSGNHGFAHANNIGVKHASGEFLLFMNPDVIAQPEQIRKLIAEKMAHPEIGLLTAPQTDAKGRLQKSFDRFPNLLTYFRTVRNLMRIISPGNNPDPRKRHKTILNCDWISGSLILINKADFARIGGWNEDYWMYAEDMDLCKRAENLNINRAVTPTAEFIHAHGGSSRINPDVTLITKSEVMYSAHVYVENHFRGLHKLVNHAILVSRNLIPLMLYGLMNLVTFGLNKKIRLRAGLLKLLISYYWLVARTGNWLSKRSVNYSSK